MLINWLISGTVTSGPKPRTSKYRVVMGTEYDKWQHLKLPDCSGTLFPDGGVHIRGATHYCLYERQNCCRPDLKHSLPIWLTVRGTQCASGAALAYKIQNQQPNRSAQIEFTTAPLPEVSFL